MVSVMDIPVYYGLNDEKIDTHLLFSDELIAQFRADGAVVGSWTDVFTTSGLGPLDGAAPCVDAISNYLDDAFYYLSPCYRPTIGESELDFNKNAWIEALNLMGVKIVPELYQGVTVNIYAEPTKTESSRIGEFYTIPYLGQSPNVFGSTILTAGGVGNDANIICQSSALGVSNETNLYFRIYPNDFRDGDKLTLSGVIADVAYVRVKVGGMVQVGDIRLYTVGSVSVILETLDGDQVLHKNAVDGKTFNTLDI